MSDKRIDGIFTKIVRVRGVGWRGFLQATSDPAYLRFIIGLIAKGKI